MVRNDFNPCIRQEFQTVYKYTLVKKNEPLNRFLIQFIN